MLVVLPLTALIFVVLGILIKYFKWYFLIAGYNTMPREKKQKVDIKGLGRFMGNFCFLLGGIMFTASFLSYLDYPLAAQLTILSLMVIIPVMLIKAQHFDANTRNPDGTMKMSVKIVIGSLVALFALIGVFLYFGALPSEVLADHQGVQINGIYGMEIEWNEIAAISLEDDFPAVIRKTNGFDFGSILKGSFILHDACRARIYVNTKKPPFIYITTADGLIIVNQGNSQKTEALFRTLSNYYQEGFF